MVKTKTVFECQTCSSQFPKWLGRCSECSGWNTLVETTYDSVSAKGNQSTSVESQIIALNDIDIINYNAVPTDIEEFDLVLSGGLVPGSVTLIGGAPGIGKSTLVMQIVGSLAKKNLRSLYASAEESVVQIKGRANRLDVASENIDVVSTSNVDDIISHARSSKCSVLIVDSIHTVMSEEISSTAGTVSQVRQCAHLLTEFAKSTDTTVILVGQVTKEGTLAGPRVLEHIVDTVLSFEGDDQSFIRTLRVNKHRFGTTEELGLFDMTENGLVALSDPSELMTFAGNNRPSGLCIASALDGSRPFLVEVQALVVPTTAPVPRRIVQGVENARVSSLIAVLQKRCGFSLSQCDVYVSLVGGIKIKDAGLDLAICVAIASADKDVVVSRDDVFVGEVGLSGEIRPGMHLLRRIREASRRGHKRIFINTSKIDSQELDEQGITVSKCESIREVLTICGLMG